MKVAILGSGGMGATVIEHLRGCSLVQEIIAVDLRPERLAEVHKRFGVRTSLELAPVLADPAIRLCFVTASNDAHRHLTIAALEAGKAVMCEKPMANTLEDAQAMVDAAARCGGFLQIGFELRYSRLYTTVKNWIDRGLLGRVVNTHCFYICSEGWRKRSWRCKKAAGGAMFGEKLSHYVDLPRWWIGEPVTEVHSFCAPNTIPYYEVRDNYHTTYRFESGAVSHLTFAMGVAAKFNGDPLQNVVSQQAGDGHYLRYLVQGTEGAAETDVFNRTIKRWRYTHGDDGLDSELLETLRWLPEDDHAYFHNTRDQAIDIVHRVAEGLEPRTEAADALETMRLCFAAELSADERRPVELQELATTSEITSAR